MDAKFKTVCRIALDLIEGVECSSTIVKAQINNVIRHAPPEIRPSLERLNALVPPERVYRTLTLLKQYSDTLPLDTFKSQADMLLGPGVGLKLLAEMRHFRALYQRQCETLAVDSADYQTVMALFRTTLPHVTILKIERIVNPELYGAYKTTVGSRIESELLLFHGSRQSSYVNIHIFGFDKRHSRAGTMGKGIYFAKHASYSHNYACPYRTETGQEARSMLACKVVLGPDSGTSGDIYCVRSDHEAYPEYIIHYS